MSYLVVRWYIVPLSRSGLIMSVGDIHSGGLVRSWWISVNVNLGDEYAASVGYTVQVGVDLEVDA